jgi:hypothetical protein
MSDGGRQTATCSGDVQRREAAAAAKGSGVTAERVLQRAHALGLMGALGGTVVDQWSDGASSAEAAYVQSLRDVRQQRWLEATNLELTWTALGRWESFISCVKRTPFIPAQGAEAASGKAYNRDTLELFREHVRREGRLQSRAGSSGTVSADYIQGLVGAIRLLRSRAAGYDVAPNDEDMVGSLVSKHMRRQDPPSFERSLSAGVRAQDIEQAAFNGFDFSTRSGSRDHAVATLGHSAMLRGGEPGAQDRSKGAVDWRRVLTLRKIEFEQGFHDSGGEEWLVAWVVPIKDFRGSGRGYPIAVQRRGGPAGADFTCAYDATKKWWLARVAEVGAATQSRPSSVVPGGRTVYCTNEEPLFVNDSGELWRTADTKRLCKRIAEAAGKNPADVGAKALRVGGAIDWRAWLGDAEGERIIRERGRWDSLTERIYARPMLTTHLKASALVGGARGVTVEDAFPGFAQPAFR